MFWLGPVYLLYVQFNFCTEFCVLKIKHNIVYIIWRTCYIRNWINNSVLFKKVVHDSIYSRQYQIRCTSDPVFLNIDQVLWTSSQGEPRNCPWSLYSKVNWKSYCTHFLYCPAQRSWLDFIAVYRPLPCVTLSLL